MLARAIQLSRFKSRFQRRFPSSDALFWTVRRWLVVSLLGGVLGLALTYLPAVQRVSVGLLEKANLAHTVSDWLFATIWWSVVIFILHGVLAVRLKHFRGWLLLRHPPLALGLFLAIPASLLWKLARSPLHPVNEKSFHVAATAIAVTTIWLFGPLLLRWLITREESDNPNPTMDAGSVIPSDSDTDRFLIWLKQERPVRGRTDDHFSMSGRAARILSALRSVERQTVGITGPFGSGKSSLVALVEELAAVESDGRPRLWFAKTSCWGFHDPAAAQEAVLQQAMKTLADELDVWTLRSLPEDYVKALSATSGWANFGLSILRPVAEPVAQLRRLSPLLSAVHARLVIVVEDVDRNGPGYDFSHIQAMLHQFREVDGISFVLSADPMRAPLDFAKLCEHREGVPSLEHEQVAVIADRVRNDCLSRYPEDVDLASPRNTLRVSTEERRPLLDDPGLGRYQDWRLSLAALLGTPRALKLALRRFSQAWDELHGEVDFDELLITSTLRVAAPEAFDFLESHIRAFKMLSAEKVSWTGRDNKGGDEAAQAVQEGWQRLVDARHPQLLHASVLISKLFPKAASIFDIRVIHEH